ncbi:MAG: hypothetical protein C5B50_24095 [Verrucomicrobia bacterium]|nr:MAG: hypothetical protein C5B50_24095 [Verrucomicrobiota bacterium]
MQAWKLVLDEAAFQFFVASRSAQRRRLLSALDDLRSNPQREADYLTKDSTDRTLNVVAVRPFLITYWLDAFGLEVRIVDIEEIHV